jgi:hypothetical protein
MKTRIMQDDMRPPEAKVCVDPVSPEMKRPSNVAARMGTGHWKTAVFGWLAFVVAAIAVGLAVGYRCTQPIGGHR